MKKITMSVVILTISGVAFAAYSGSNGQPVAMTDLFTVPEAGALFLFGSGLIGLVSYRRIRRMQ
jgi:PEP-CTERM motif